MVRPIPELSQLPLARVWFFDGFSRKYQRLLSLYNKFHWGEKKSVFLKQYFNLKEQMEVHEKKCQCYINILAMQNKVQEQTRE